MSNYWPIKPDTWPFSAVYVSSPMSGVLRLSWQLEPTLRDADPWMFSVEQNDNADEPGNWRRVAGPASDVSALDIPVPPNVGKTTTTHVRIKLVTGDNTYYSNQRSLSSILTEKLLIYAQAISRRLLLERTGMPRVRGWLLKRRLSGQVCGCMDPLANVPTKSACTTCYGTGIVGGYWKATEGAMFVTADPQIRSSMEMGFTTPVSRDGILIGVPFVMVGDIWVDQVRDDRYMIAQVAPSELHGLQLSCTVRAELLPSSDVVYKYKIQ